MTARQYLESIENLKNLITNKQQEIDAYREVLGVGAIDYSKDRIVSGGKNVTEEKLVKLADMDQRQMERMKALQERIDEAVGLIFALESPRLSTVLYKKYIKQKSLNEISEEEGYSYDWTRHLNMDGIRAFAITHKEFLKKKTR